MKNLPSVRPTSTPTQLDTLASIPAVANSIVSIVNSCNETKVAIRKIDAEYSIKSKELDYNYQAHCKSLESQERRFYKVLESDKLSENSKVEILVRLI